MIFSVCFYSPIIILLPSLFQSPSIILSFHVYFFYPSCFCLSLVFFTETANSLTFLLNMVLFKIFSFASSARSFFTKTNKRFLTFVFRICGFGILWKWSNNFFYRLALFGVGVYRIRPFVYSLYEYLNFFPLYTHYSLLHIHFYFSVGRKFSQYHSFLFL